jgi:hypothetical protein
MAIGGSATRHAAALEPPVVSQTFKRFYEPDSVRLMADALDFACRLLPTPVRESESVRRRLALSIMRELDAGERDPARIAAVAALSIRI